MFKFRDKIVYIISPERWGTMKVSKHHYAMELAATNCRIFFIEPPSLLNKSIEIIDCKDHHLISIVRYRPVYRGKRFLPPFLYRILLKRQVRLLLQKITLPPDVVWCFQGYLFERLEWFGAPVNLFFAADQFFYKKLPPEIYSATLSLAVSDTIYETIKKSGKRVFQINHGLQKIFVQGASDVLTSKPKRVNKVIVAGYTGNLCMEALDRRSMKKIIEQNELVRFIFWGSYKMNELNLGGMDNAETHEFVEFLEKRNNVELRGVVNSEQLHEQMKESNLFWLCWQIGINVLWDGSNSHKILEYLSTGCPVVAHHVSSYKNTELIYMLPTKENKGYDELFSKTIELVKKGEPEEKVKKRLSFAIENSYQAKILQIEALVNGE